MYYLIIRYIERDWQ